jgi:SAM-dependent methyltransferase
MTMPDLQPEVGWSSLATKWDTSGADWNTPVAERLVELAGLRTGMTVLDVGCGAGAATFAAARAAGETGRAIGVDSAAAMVHRARYDGRDRGIRNVLFAIEDAAQLSYPAETFDAVISSMVVRYLPDLAKALRGWRYVLKPRGLLAFSWVAHDDPAWQPVLAAVDRFVPAGQTGWTQRKRRTIPGMEALLPPELSVVTITEPFTTRYKNAGHFWESSWTQAPATAWSQIPESQRHEARAAAFEVLAGLAARDGSLERTREVCYTIGRLPSPATVPAQAKGG